MGTRLSMRKKKAPGEDPRRDPFIDSLLGNMTPVKVVQKTVGHSKAQMTLDIYGHVLKEQETSAAETMDRLFPSD